MGGGAAGPTYYMPGSTEPAVRAGQYTRQKPRQQMRSFLASGGGIKDALAESSFNQSFPTSTEKYGTVRSQITSPRQAWGAAPNKPPSPKQPGSSRYETKGRATHHGGQPASGFKYFAGAEKHNDSLFESSKASTNNQTSIMRRQFNKGQAIKVNHGRPAEMYGAAVFGSKVRPSQPTGPVTQPSVAMRSGSTKPGSQITAEANADTRSPTADQVAVKTHQVPDDSQLAEASFAAPNAQTQP